MAERQGSVRARATIRRDDDVLEALVPRARSGDERACAAFYEALRPRFRRIAAHELVRRGLVLDEGELDDVVQEALIDTWLIDLPRFEVGRSPLWSFLRRRVRWTLLERVRGRARQRTRSLEDERARGVDVEAEGASPDERLRAAAAERTLLSFPRAVAAAAARLEDDAARVAILRHDVEGAPLRQVALELGVHPSNATRARQRGLQRLRRDLAPHWSEAAREPAAADCS